MRKLSKSKSTGSSEKASQSATALRLATYRTDPTSAAGGGAAASTESPKVSPNSPDTDQGSSGEPVAGTERSSEPVMSGLDQPSTSRDTRDTAKVSERARDASVCGASIIDCFVLGRRISILSVRVCVRADL